MTYSVTNQSFTQMQTLMKTLEENEQDFSKQMESQQDLEKEEGQTRVKLDQPLTKPTMSKKDVGKFGLEKEGAPSKPVNGEVALLVAMASVMDENQKVMGSQALGMEAINADVGQINNQLNQLTQEQEGLLNLSSSSINSESASLNQQSLEINAQLNNATTSANQDGMNINTFAQESNADGGIAQAILSDVIDQQARGMA